ncbi:SBBP repeat-containing protein [Gloeocapsa sp. PCC 73106]|uniref:SBBP repeat-containing protein n=1 Tax=Gloeocapsa sp. PCC 73106 TaxID=102232 RepID=UPI0002AC7B8F|nr:SBBP repeat-containing protein [Gloeocapsa sp. PCC 73106]ELR99281.1 Beta-propeller repeat protein [Gloeocapsa sp. PCC 73106]
MVFIISADQAVVTPGTPGSDTLQLGTSRLATINEGVIFASDVLFTREGQDQLIAVDPEADLPGSQEVDILLGDQNPPGLPAPPIQFTSPDTFVLGDRFKPYYDDGVANTLGKEDFALIFDFTPAQDIIRLHGSVTDYTLQQESLLVAPGVTIPVTEIYFNSTDPELIGVIAGIPPAGLDLNASYFEYDNEAPEAPGRAASSSIKHLATRGIDIPFSNAFNPRGVLFTVGYTTGPLTGEDFGDTDAFVTTFNRFGQKGTSIQLGTEEADFGHGIAVDRRNNFYVTGRTRGDLGGENPGTVGATTDTFVALYNTLGTQQWIRQFGTPGVDNSFSDPILDLDNSDHLLLAGYTTGDLFGPNAGPGATDAWITKYDTEGNQQWGVQFGTPAFDEVFALETDGQDNIYTAGWTLGSFPGNTNAGLYDIFLAKTNTTTGEQEWIKQFGTPNYDWVWGMEHDGQGNLYLTGWTLGDLGGPNSGSYDAWLGKFDSEGNQIWIKQFGTTGDDQAIDIDIDTLGNVYLAGTTNGAIGSLYDPETGNETDDTPDGSFDAWAAKFDADGNALWTTQLGTTELEGGSDIEVFRNRVLVTGITEGSLGATHLNSYDGWIAQLNATDGGLTRGFGNNNLIVDNTNGNAV